MTSSSPSPPSYRWARRGFEAGSLPPGRCIWMRISGRIPSCVVRSSTSRRGNLGKSRCIPLSTTPPVHWAASPVVALLIWPSPRSTSSSAICSQIDPAKFKNILGGFSVLLKEQGFRGFFKGWVPTLLGYSAQGGCKFGFYEFFKKVYSELSGPEHASKHKTLIYLAGSASAEMIAVVALCPMEAVKVRIQTQPGFAKGLRDGLPKFVASEGIPGLYKGLVPLWGRQIPYTMMKFASFETIVEMIYKHVIPKPKEECSKPLQLAVSFAGGYMAGVLCAVVSHPADNLVSFLNNTKEATITDAVRRLGLHGLFTRGLLLRIVMIGTLTGAQWGIYDTFKVLIGLPTTGGVAPRPTVSSEKHAKQS
ncbi:mitochondrial phosphate carrier protein 3, mitochondrial-like isoform X3 [Zingiber officinale]|uniref:mitochondrial phosphate carrier protein 3, mitochondrial-like isoform X3 n=1 Tax=Zingiber officinale TaxID=94328 RepID=UPI001C4B9F5E|nr:mitochondrial phosphate carrier protein 3, mitochondrial-like isoform X3 [Zingiber officinale]